MKYFKLKKEIEELEQIVHNLHQQAVFFKITIKNHKSRLDDLKISYEKFNKILISFSESELQIKLGALEREYKRVLQGKDCSSNSMILERQIQDFKELIETKKILGL